MRIAGVRSAVGPAVTNGAAHAGEPKSRSAQPTISVVLPVRNGEPWLAIQLAALAAQDYPGEWEVIAVDNGSTDGTDATLTAWADRLPLRTVNAAERAGINYARNLGCEQATGDLLVFCDADDVVSPQWLSELGRQAKDWDIVGGRLDEDSLNGVGMPVQRPRLPLGRLPVALEFLPFALGANFAVWRDVREDLGGFDESYPFGNDDVEYSFRAQLKGYRLGYIPTAVVAYRHRQEPRALFNQFRNYGRAEPQLYRRYGPEGMPRAPLRRAGWRWVRLAVGSWALLASPVRRGRWVAELGFTIGRIEGSIRQRRVYL